MGKLLLSLVIGALLINAFAVPTAFPDHIVFTQSERLLQQGQPEQALQALSDYGKLDHPAVHNTAARAFLQLGELDKTLELLQAHHADADWETYYHLGTAYYRSGAYEEALSSLRAGLELREHAVLLQNRQADVLHAMGRTEDAIEVLERSLRFDQSQDHLRWTIGEWAESVGDKEKALQAYTRVQSLYPDPSVAARITALRRELPPPPPQPTPTRTGPSLIEHTAVEPVPDYAPVRVGLLERAASLTLSAGAPFTAVDTAGTTVELEGNRLWEVQHREGNPEHVTFAAGDTVHELTAPVSLTLTDPTTTFALYDIAYGQGYYWAGRETRQYRETLELLPFEQGLTIVNELPLEAYLYSVTAAEMSPSWHSEALKAQAVAARTYSEFHRRRYASRGFDLLSTVLSAHYPGVGREHPNTTEAVNATRGEILVHNGAPIDAVYSANSGGLLSSSAEVWGGQRAYLPAAADGGSFPDEGFDLAAWLRHDVDSYSNVGRQLSSYRWVRDYSRTDLERLAPADIGNLTDLVILERGPSHRVSAVQWIGTDDVVTVRRDAIRRSLGGLRSNLFIFYPSYKEGQLQGLTIYGGGWGHGVGMSQYGALGMAEAGKDYRTILTHYYPATTIEIRGVPDDEQ